MRKLAALAVLILGGLALLGAGRGGTYTGGTYAGAGASYQAGGVAAGWDTITIVYTTQDVLTDDNNPASIDTSLVLGIPGSEFGSTATTTDYARRLQFTAALAGADSCYRLGTGFHVPNFAWGVLDRADTNGYNNQVRAPLINTVRIATSPIGTNVYALDAKFPFGADGAAGARAAVLTYLPWQNRLPRNCTIVSAKINVSNYGNSQYVELDTLISVLMTNAADNDWYTVKGMANYPDYAHASWNRQNDDNGDAWTGDEANAWSPTLNNRTYYWDMGSVCDWSGSVVPNGTGFTAIGTGWPIDITDCVQAAVSGTTNNGIVTLGCDGNSATSNDWGFRGYDDYGEAIGRTPYIVVKYITKRYQKPFGSSDFALVISTDDARYPANRAYADTFKAHGAKYTIYMARDQIGVGSGSPSTAAQLVAFRTADGMEVGSHSVHHKTTHGLTFWHSIGMADTNSAGWDSLMVDAKTSWMYHIADSLGVDLRSDPLFAKTIALPESQISPEVGLALDKVGYQAVRYKAMAPAVTGWRHYSVANTKRAAAGDSASAGFPSYYGRAPRNMVLLPTTVTVQTVFARRANAQTTEAELDSLKQNYRRLAYQIRGQDRGVISLFWHDFKTGYSVDYGGEGVDGIELGAVLDENDALGGRYMTVSEYAAWIKSGATAVASPNRAAVPDTFESTAGQLIWYKPNGIDNRWIRGVK